MSGNPEWQGKSIGELERMLRAEMDYVYRLRMEIDRRKGDVPKGIAVDFTQYLTE
jgi:hypothetical protein